MLRRVSLAVVLVAACGGGTSSPSIPTAHDAPWPKFRGDAKQTGRSTVHATTTGGALWSFPTGKGVFSSPIVGADGTVYVGSASRYFYALDPATGQPKWMHLTGEIIDSAALLDDQGRVYVGSGDGNLYAFDAASGNVDWQFAADAPGPASIINWYEGNVAIGPDGTLYAGNDNFHFYGVNRDGTRAWSTDMPDQTWSSAAVDPKTGQLYVGNNAMLQAFGANLWSFDDTGTRVWRHSAANGSIAASPLLTDDGAVIIGGFDGYVRSIDTTTNQERWNFPTRDHVYASAATLSDGTIVVPSADGTIYALDPKTGAQKWAFDTLEPIRSSPAVDADDHIYFGSGEGRLFVLNADGTRRWAMRLITDTRNDINASPALGKDAIYIGGESGEVFSVPYDYCLRDVAATDTRCAVGPGEDLPSDSASLLVTTPLGAPLATAPASIDANQSLTLSLFVRAKGDTTLAMLDSSSVKVDVTPTNAVDMQVSADRRFIVVTPQPRFTPDTSGNISVHVTGQYLVNPMRDGLAFSGGTPGGNIDQTFTFALNAAPTTPFQLVAPTNPGDPATALEIYRLAAPLPTILPSYNQIGFDSLHYVVGLVEGSGNHYVAWVVGGKLDDQNNTVVDPTTQGVFALDVDYTDGLATFENNAGFSLVAMGATLTFSSFRVAARFAPDGTVPNDTAFVVSAQCQDIQLYGPFLAQLGLCNPDTNTLLVSGGTLLRAFGTGTTTAPTGVGTVKFSASATGITATLTGSTIALADHAVGVLLVDSSTGKPLSLDYGLATTRTTNPDGTLATVAIALTNPPNGTYRTYLMIDTYPAAKGTISLPPP